MKITSNQIDKHLYTIELQDTPEYSGSILHELEKETRWTLHENSDGSYIGDFVPTDTDTNLFKYRDNILSDNFKYQLYSLLTSNDVFIDRHPTYTVDFLMDNAKLFSQYYVVSEDHKLGGQHVDEPINQIIALGLVYFMYEDNPLKGTLIRNWNDTHNIIVPTGYEKGWLLINSDKSKHQICNFGLKRYGIKFWVNVF